MCRSFRELNNICSCSLLCHHEQNSTVSFKYHHIRLIKVGFHLFLFFQFYFNVYVVT